MTGLELEVRDDWMRWVSAVPRRPLHRDRALCASLAVCSDQLQQAGDPRGELIALDLSADRTDAVMRRRRQLQGNAPG